MSTVWGLMLAAALLASPQEAVREEATDYFRKWLNQDVVYIITRDEREVFERLQTADEKERFIEQFWLRRNPNPGGGFNEFKEEHYRRLAYVNERFTSGFPGWLTDRGRIYIIHGPPDEIETYPTGGLYERPMEEGGGKTAAYPFEVWRYRHVEGVGSEIRLEFVDRSLTGEYRLALEPEEKDALLYVTGAGQTMAELLGEASRAERPFFTPSMRGRYPYAGSDIRQDPFYRLQELTQMQKPPEIQYRDLKEIVEVDVGFEAFQIDSRIDYIRLSSEQVLIPLTLQVSNHELSFQREGEVEIARVALYGLVTTMGRQVVQEFEDEMVIALLPQEAVAGRKRKSIYQRFLPTLSGGAQYRLDVALKDLNSGNIGIVRRGLTVPRYPPERLSASSMILSNSIREVDPETSATDMFVLGDLRIRPSLDHSFPIGSTLGAYLQLYGVRLDQSSLRPDLRIHWRLMGEDGLILEWTDEAGEAVRTYSVDRTVLVKGLNLARLEAGAYRLEVDVHDDIAGASISLSQEFQLGSIQ